MSYEREVKCYQSIMANTIRNAKCRTVIPPELIRSKPTNMRQLMSEGMEIRMFYECDADNILNNIELARTTILAVCIEANEYLLSNECKNTRLAEFARYVAVVLCTDIDNCSLLDTWRVEHSNAVPWDRLPNPLQTILTGILAMPSMAFNILLNIEEIITIELARFFGQYTPRFKIPRVHKCVKSCKYIPLMTVPARVISMCFHVPMNVIHLLQKKLPLPVIGIQLHSKDGYYSRQYSREHHVLEQGYMADIVDINIPTIRGRGGEFSMNVGSSSPVSNFSIVELVRKLNLTHPAIHTWDLISVYSLAEIKLDFDALKLVTGYICKEFYELLVKNIDYITEMKALKLNKLRIPPPKNLDLRYYSNEVSQIANLLKCGASASDIIQYYSSYFNILDIGYLGPKRCKEVLDELLSKTNGLMNIEMMQMLAYVDVIVPPSNLTLQPYEVPSLRVWEWACKHASWAERVTTHGEDGLPTIAIHNHTFFRFITDSMLTRGLSTPVDAIVTELLPHIYATHVKHIIDSTREFKAPPFPNLDQIVFIDNAVKLYNEGQVMKHCISGYAHRCDTGLSYIFHVDDGTEKGATVELDKDFKIVECRGYRNADAHAARQTMQIYLNAFFKLV